MPIYRVPEIVPSFNGQNKRHEMQNGRTEELRHRGIHRQSQQHHYQHQNQRQQKRPEGREDVVKQPQSKPVRVAEPGIVSSEMNSDSLEESIVEREIRLQLEKEAEIASLHKDLRHMQMTPSRSMQPGESTKAESTTTLEKRKDSQPETTPDAETDRTMEIEDGRKVINQYSKVGESLIVKELMEQKRREEELRRHYTNIGMIKERDENGKNYSGKDDAEIRSGNARSALKVQPFEDPENEEDRLDVRQTYITPQRESVIEREIRLLRQREGSLRRVRGYPLLSREERLKEVEIRPTSLNLTSVDKQKMMHPGGATMKGELEGDEESMKRLATNRLKQEILRERQRELDLRRQGKIYPISEERVGLEQQPNTTRSSITDYDSIDASRKSHLERGEASTPREARHSPGSQPRYGLHLDTKGHQRDSEKFGDQSRFNEVKQNRYSETLPSWKTAAELRIEAEVKEARRREKELREQRRLANATLTSPQLNPPSDQISNSLHRTT